MTENVSEPTIVSPYERTNDDNGYAVYSVVLIATLHQQAAVDAVRKSVGNRRSMIPAHITVKGTFCEIPSLDEIVSHLRSVARDTTKFDVVFGTDGVKKRTIADGGGFAGQSIQKTAELVQLHNGLYDSIAPITTNAYGREDGDHYRPHMTIFHEPSPELEHQTDDLLLSLDIGEGYECDAMFLMGHIGRPYRGRWTVVREVPFG